MAPEVDPEMVSEVDPEMAPAVDPVMVLEVEPEMAPEMVLEASVSKTKRFPTPTAGARR